MDFLEHDIEQAMKAMVARGAISVPPYPAIALKLGALVSQETFGLQEVVRLVSADAALAVDLVRCASSSAYGRGSAVTSLQQAVSRLGAKEVVRLAVASALAKTAHAPGPLQTMKRSAWQRNIASAALCDELAKLRGLPREDAFLCGLLHDYGRLIAISSLEEILAAMPEVGVRPLAFWESLVERRRVELGTLLATKWRLPKVFQEVMAIQYADAGARTGPNAKIVDVVAASDAIVQLLLSSHHIDADALLSVPRLDGSERTRLADLMPTIPSLIASFEGDAEERPQPSKVAVAETRLEEGFRRVELTLHQLKPRKRGPYAVRGIGSGAWVMTGKDSIAPNSLIEVTIECEPKAITLWAHVMRSAPEDGGVRAVCKAFAVNGPTSETLFQLFRNAPHEASGVAA
jgi:HD-like signal output (HDOD) protein